MTTDHIASGTFSGGIHPPDGKEAARSQPIVAIAHPQKLMIPLLQHRGAPAECAVKPRQTVVRGEVIATANGNMSVCIHAPLSGVLAKETKTTLANGRRVAALPLEVKGENPTPESILAEITKPQWPIETLADSQPADLLQRIRDAGLLGMGGAAFPTHVKLGGMPGKQADTILINGCECEPFLAADERLMIEAAPAIIAGALAAARITGAARIVIATENTKPAAIQSMQAAAAGHPTITVIALDAKYPMGGEKQTVRAALGRTIPSGRLPLDIGVVVINVGTAKMIARAVFDRQAPMHRVLTVSGPGVKNPGNLLVPVGITLRACLEACGGLVSENVRVISGGPMMGFTVGSLDAPVTLATSGITVLLPDVGGETMPCIHCGRCVDVCPLGLVPQKLSLACEHKAWDAAKRYHLDLCMECGCCVYACPSHIPLVQNIRVGKATIPRT